MKYLYFITLLFLPTISFSQQVQTNIWSKENKFTVGEGAFKSTHSTGTNSISIGYEPLNEYNVTIKILITGGGREESIKLYGNEYEVFKRIIETYTEWRKAAIASDIALEKVMYETKSNFEFKSSFNPFNYSLLNEKPKVITKSLEIMYKNGSLSFIIKENNSYSNSIELSESEMIAIVGVFTNKARISEVETKLKVKSKSWDSFQPLH